MLTLTVGRSPYQENSESAMAVTFDMDAALPLTAEILTAAAEQFLAQNDVTGTVSNPRILHDGVTEDEDGGTPKPKGRAKINSDAFDGDVWIRLARKAKDGTRLTRAQLEARVAELEAILTQNKISFSAAA